MTTRLIAADLDGTLMGRSLRFSPRLQNVLRQVKEKGVYFTVSTGRIFEEALPYVSQLPVTAPVICSQGGYIRNLDASAPLFEASLPVGLAREAIQFSRETPGYLHMYQDHRAYTEHPLVSEEQYHQTFGMRVRIVSDLLACLDEKPTKFLIMGRDPDETTQLHQILTGRFGGRLGIVRSHPYFVEIIPLDTSKGWGLAWLAEYLHVPQETVMAIGDQDNDVDMVAWAGLGVAMGNATPRVKAVADYIAPSVDEDGAAEAIERLVLS